jgi:hypothetical protein
MKDSLIYFAVKFCIAAAVLLAVFNFVFPYYRALLNASIGLITSAANLQISQNIFLTFMPYVSLSALVVSAPKRSTKEKAKFITLIFALFYLIDVSFSIVQVFAQGTPIRYYHVLLVQDFFAIALPVVIWVLIQSKNLIRQPALEES